MEGGNRPCGRSDRSPLTMGTIGGQTGRCDKRCSNAPYYGISLEQAHERTAGKMGPPRLHRSGKPPQNHHGQDCYPSQARERLPKPNSPRSKPTPSPKKLPRDSFLRHRRRRARRRRPYTLASRRSRCEGGTKTPLPAAPQIIQKTESLRGDYGVAKTSDFGYTPISLESQ
jgi:hypothetical protein